MGDAKYWLSNEERQETLRPHGFGDGLNISGTYVLYPGFKGGSQI